MNKKSASKETKAAQSAEATDKKLSTFFFPTLGVSVEAKDREEALAKAEELNKQKESEVSDGNL